MKSQAERAEVFKQLHEREGCFVIPNPWDVGTARLLERTGFEALATTSAGLAFSLGKKDGKGTLTRDEVLENAQAMINATSLPLSADLENGYAETVEGIAETITLAASCGLVGGSIEDMVGQPGTTVFQLETAVDRVHAACEAAQALDFPFLITARAENYRFGRKDLKDTIARLQAFQEAGADVLYAPGVTRKEDIAEIVKSVDKPVNVLMGLEGTDMSLEELTALGVKRVSLGSSLSRIALGGFLAAAREAKEGSFSFGDRAVPFKDINKLF